MIDLLLGFPLYYIKFCGGILWGVILAVLAFIPVILFFTFYEDKIVPWVKGLSKRVPTPP